MTFARLLLCTLALAPAACATHAQTTGAATPSAPRYKLCTDPQFDCVAPEFSPVRVDTNLTTPAAKRSALS